MNKEKLLQGHCPSRLCLSLSVMTGKPLYNLCQGCPLDSTVVILPPRVGGRQWDANGPAIKRWQQQCGLLVAHILAIDHDQTRLLVGHCSVGGASQSGTGQWQIAFSDRARRRRRRSLASGYCMLAMKNRLAMAILIPCL